MRRLTVFTRSVPRAKHSPRGNAVRQQENREPKRERPAVGRAYERLANGREGNDHPEPDQSEAGGR